MANNLLSAKKLLLVSKTNLTIADYLCLQVILELLKQKGTAITLCSQQPLDKQFRNIVPLPQVETITKIPTRKFILSFSKGGSTIKNVQWSQSDTELSFHISLDHGQFNPEGMNLVAEGADFDTIFFYHIDNFAQVQQYFGEFPDIVKQTKNVATKRGMQIAGAEVELFGDQTSASLAETVYQNYRSAGLTPEQLTRLFAAVLSTTSRFRKQTSAQTFLICSELLEQGAKLDQANSILDRGSNQPKANKPTAPLTSASGDQKRPAKPAAEAPNKQEEHAQPAEDDQQ